MKYTRKNLIHTNDFQEKLYNEIIGRIKKEDESVPFFHNGYWYYTKYEKTGEYPIYCRKKETLQHTEEILLNVNEMAKEHEYYDATDIKISPDNKLMAFAEDKLSRPDLHYEV